LLLACLGFSPTALTADILVLQSHDSAPYRQALEGFRNTLTDTGLALSYSVHDTSNGTAMWPYPETDRLKLIFTLGTPATRLALAHEAHTPVVAGLLLNTDELRQHRNATGVGLAFPVARQWQWLRRLLPKVRQIVVIYDPEHDRALLPELQKLAQSEQISLALAAAVSPEDLPSVLQNLPAQADAIWVLGGVAAFNASAAVQELLLYSFRNRMPVIGLSAQWVKAGALYALDWDYTDLGRQAADLAAAILQKSAIPAHLPPLAPRKIRPVFNPKTAEHMKLEISKQWLPEMVEVSQ